MIDYSLVSLDFPSIYFFFAHLCGLLKVVVKRRPKVGLFVGRNCPFRFVLHFLLPLVHRSMGIAQTLVVFGKGEVRSSKLKIGLSLSEDNRALEVTSPSTPHKAWGYIVLSRKKTRRGLEIGSNSLLL